VVLEIIRSIKELVRITRLIVGGMLHLIYKYKRDDSVPNEVRRNTVFFGYDVASTGAHTRVS